MRKLRHSIHLGERYRSYAISVFADRLMSEYLLVSFLQLSAGGQHHSRGIPA
jgi:hypothetical protein